jgi:4-aminobutyrate aminotransferase/(S)-3-amino-2-methylpropionate transaminase
MTPMTTLQAPPTPQLTGGPGLEQRRRLVTEVPGPRSRQLAQRRAAALPAGLASAAGVYVAAAGGGVVVDVDGNSFIDMGSGIAVTTVGNAAAGVVARAADQLTRYTHTCFLATPYEPYIEVAEVLNRLTPGEHPKRTALFNTGAEAVENAVKYARAFTGRPAVVVFDHAFHGRSLLTMTMTGTAKPYKHGFGPFAPEVYRAPMAYPYRWPSGPQHCAREAMTQFAQLIDAQIGADMVAAVVVEPIQGEGGFIVPADGFLSAVAEFCRSRGIVLVADEVQTGIARTGSWFACEHDGLVPDLIVTAKGLAGGLPLAAVTGRAEIMDAAPPGGIGGTYSGNPAACAAALGSIEEIEDNDLLARARRIGERLTAGLRSINTPVIGEVRGRGAMIAAELVRPGTRDPNPEAVAAVTRYCHDHGVLTLSAGTFGNVLRFLPPLSITDELLDDAMGVLADAFAAL